MESFKYIMAIGLVIALSQMLRAKLKYIAPDAVNVLLGNTINDKSTLIIIDVSIFLAILALV